MRYDKGYDISICLSSKGKCDGKFSSNVTSFEDPKVASIQNHLH